MTKNSKELVLETNQLGTSELISIELEWIPGKRSQYMLQVRIRQKLLEHESFNLVDFVFTNVINLHIPREFSGATEHVYLVARDVSSNGWANIDYSVSLDGEHMCHFDCEDFHVILS